MPAIAVLSGKGGVGKTTTAINLCHALTLLGRRAVILDANLTAPNLHLHLGGTGFPRMFNDVLKGTAAITTAIYQHASGIPIIPGSPAVRDLEDLDLSKGFLAIQDLKRHFDTIIIDGAAGLGREALFSLELADEVLLVTTPDLPAASGAMRVHAAARSLRKTPLGIVLTQVRDESHELSDSAIADLTSLPIIARVPYQREIRESMVKKYPATHTAPHTRAAQEYFSLAHRLLGTKYRPDVETNVFYSMLRTAGIRVNR